MIEPSVPLIALFERELGANGEVYCSLPDAHMAQCHSPQLSGWEEAPAAACQAAEVLD